MAESFPLDWPLGYKRTVSKINSKFKQVLPDKVQTLLYQELKKLGAKSIVVSSNAPLRRDGFIYSEYLMKKIEDPGVAVYFKFDGEDVVMCCDQYYFAIDNMYAIAKGIEAIRSMERWGVSDFIKRAFSGFKALPEDTTGGKQWWEILGVPPAANKEDIKTAYRNLAKIHHPDAGGTSALFNRITEAYNEGMKPN